MPRTPPWVRFYQDRWLGSSKLAALTSAQEGIYIRLLAHQANEGMAGLPGGDWTRCLPLLKRDASEEDIQLIVEEFFPEWKDGRRRNDRMHEMVELAANYSERQVERGQAGGIASAQARAQARAQAPATPCAVASLSPESSCLSPESGDPMPDARDPREEAVEQPLVALKRDRSRSPDVNLVVQHYQTHHPKARPGKKERALIAARLIDGYSTADLCAAIDGYHRSPFHLGDNPAGKTYLALALFMRDSTHVQAGMEIASGEGQGQPMSDITRQNMAAAEAFLRNRSEERPDATGR